MNASFSSADNARLDQAQKIKDLGRELGFADVGIADATPGQHATYLEKWLAADYHGEMDYMQRHAALRAQPDQLQPGAVRVISVRMDYMPNAANMQETLGKPETAYVSRYALGRDYHKLMRKRLSQMAETLTEWGGESHRAFVDSAPVLERGFAEKAGLGWIGKNTMLINPKAGSWFFLGEILTDLALPVDAPQQQVHCGSCSDCLPACPTGAIVAPFKVDARRCISYLTIELRTSIPEAFRPMIGNRIFGCDDCQIVCPWNKFDKGTSEPDFAPRHNLDNASLVSLFAWSEAEFLEKTAGSPIRRIGHACWLRNIAVALGNGPPTVQAINALEARANFPNDMVQEHVTWALERLR